MWITGVPGSGKSSLARAAASQLRSLGVPVRVLELDEIRNTLTPTPTYSDVERDVVYRCLAFLAAVVTEAGAPVIIDATAHRRVWRDCARTEIPQFAEVQLICPVEVARDRERTREPGHAPRDIYARAGGPGATVPGVDVPYEPTLSPELAIDTERDGMDASVDRIVELARDLAKRSASVTSATAASWAIWITGRPGSGKTTLATRVAEAVAFRGQRVTVLDRKSLHRFGLHEAGASESEQQIVHRALACAAHILVEAGMAVIVDATAPRRSWREAARERIPRFAEVQLLCPVEVCIERERATRWHGGSVGKWDASPDICIEYEEAVRPELVLDTNAHDTWSLVEQILFVVNRLRRPLPTEPEERRGRPR
jgi:adenylylsulfate kinase